MKRSGSPLVLAALVLALAGVAASPPSQPPEHVKFLLDITPYGKHAMFYVSLDKGFWREAGFDVTIVKGEGSATTIGSLAAGAVDFGFADTASLILARGQGAKVKVVAMIHDKSLYAIETLEENGIKAPKDLEGRKIGGSTGDAARVVFPAFAQINHVDASKIHWVTMTPPARVPSLLAGQVDAIVAFATEIPTLTAKAQEVGKRSKLILYADYGLDLYSNGLLARDDAIASQPERVKRFVEATMKGVAWSVENPLEAIDLFIKHNPAVDRELAAAHFRIAVQHLMTAAAKKDGIGSMDPAKMKRTVDTITQYFPAARGVAVEDVYTSRFVPKLFPKEKAF
ncbi:MAG TPA: ABC transporter substrate-binding protein [Candidatus Methylomirabilis sp.]